MGGRPPRWRQRVLGLAIALAGGVVLSAGSGSAVPIEAPATITREAYFTNPATQITPPTLRNGFPPATACLVAGLVGAPQVCGPGIQGVAELLGLNDGLPVPVTPDQDLAQLVVPGTTPVGMLGGQQRYTSLFQLALPPLPQGERFSKFELVLKQDGLNLALESPTLRDIVLQVVSQLEDQNPTLILEAIQRALSNEVPILDTNLTGIEACPLVEGWQGGPAQGAALDGTRIPDADCALGTTGTFDPATATWTFDLTFAAQSWTTGSDGGAPPIANEGILLRPVGTPNLAYGDPDLSTNWIVSLGNGTVDPANGPLIRWDTITDTTDGTTSDGTDGIVTIPTIGTGGTDLFADTTGGLPPTTGGATDLGDPVLETIPREFITSRGHHPGWTWLGLPLLVLGAYLFGKALVAVPARNRRRPGALTRLIEIYEQQHPGAAP